MLLLVAVVCARPDSLVVNASGVSSATAIWWGTPASRDVVVWFHGGMTSGNCVKGYVAGDDFAKLFPKATVVSVSACMDKHWVTENMMNVVDAALDSVAARRRAPVDEVRLVGVSDGSLGVIVYSATGRRRVKERLLMSTFGVTLGDAPRLAVQLKEKGGRWRFLQGGADRLYPSDRACPWIEAFCKSVGADCELQYDAAGEHDWQYWKQNHLQWIRQAIFPGTP